MRAATTWVGAALLAAAYVAVDPARTIAGPALSDAARGLLAAILCAGALTAFGGALLARLGPAHAFGAARAPFGFALGLGVAGAVLLPLAAAGGGGWPAAGALLAMGAGGVLFGGLRGALGESRTPPAALLVAVVFLLIPPLFEALAPPTDTDELYYQLALARRVAHGELVGGLLHPDGSRPLPVQLVHAALFAAGGEAAPRLFHLLTVCVVLYAVFALAEARHGAGAGSFPVLALVGSWSFVREAGLAYPDHAVALWVLLAAAAALDGALRFAALLAGVALAAKDTAAPAVLAIGLFAAFDAVRAHGLGPAARVVAVGALVLVGPTLPWLARNALDGLHPLFPYAGWPDMADFTFVHPEKYGMGHTWADAAMLPWRLVFEARHDSFAFLGRLNLVWVALIGGGAWAARREPAARRLGFVLLVTFAAWANGAQILRWLLPLCGVAALFGAPSVRLGVGPLLVLTLASLPANLAPALARASEQAPAVTGLRTRTEWLDDALPAHRATRWLNANVDGDEPVGLLFAWHAYLLDHPTVLGSVEDHVPTRWWLRRHGDAALRALRARGVRWLLVGDVRFLRKSYTFLDDATFARAYAEPQAQLRRLLMAEATRAFAHERWEVWRIDVAPDPKIGVDTTAPQR